MVPLGRSRAGFTKKLDFEPNNEGPVGGGGGQVVGGGSRQKDPHWLGIGGVEQLLILWFILFHWKLQGTEAANTMGEKVLSLTELSFNPVFKGRGFEDFRAREEHENNSYSQRYCCYLLDAYHVLSAVLSNSVQSYND